MAIGILVGIYLLYIVTGMHYQFAVGWLDWNAPYLHYAVVAGGNQALPVFAAPVLALIWLGYSWYKKGMLGEA